MLNKHLTTNDILQCNGSPIDNNLMPEYVGQLCIDITNDLIYIAKTLNNNGWIASSEEIDISSKQDATDNTLSTTDKTIAGAINELKAKVDETFQEVDNGKNLIATSIGNPLITKYSTFSAMSEAILGLRRESGNTTDAREALYNMMIEDGYNNANSEMTTDELIDLLDASQIDYSGISEIICGEECGFILKKDGTVYACGDNNYGQLGLGNKDTKTTFTKINIDNVKQVSCGYGHTVILKKDGTVWSCGDNYYGQLGLGNKDTKTTFTKINIDNVKQIACGHYHTVILKNDGTIWSCGHNDSGQLGLGDYTDNRPLTQVNIDNVKQVSCGYAHTVILKNDGTIWVSGDNNFGELGLGSSGDDKCIFTQVLNIDNIKQIDCGAYHTAILKNNGTVWFCGYNKHGQLGFGANYANVEVFTQVTDINNVKQIDCGTYHTVVLKNDGSVLVSGRNDYGQLGLGDTSDKKNIFTQVNINDAKQISCGFHHTFILKNDNTLYACGYNNAGQLGLGNKDTPVYAFTQVTDTSWVSTPSSYEINRMKLYIYLFHNEIPVTENMDIGTMLNILVDVNINNMILGYENNLRIILQDEGVNITEEDDMTSLITKVDEEFTKDNNTINSLNTEKTNLTNQVNSLNKDKTNLTNQVNSLNSNIENTRSTLAGLMQEGGYDITGNESINSLLNLLVISGISVSDIKQIACGFSHTYILKHDGSLWSCGYNSNGQLGLGNNTQKTSFTKVTTNINNDVKQVACGTNSTFILKNDGSLWSCGANGNGQLGLGTSDTNVHTTFTKVTKNINNDVKQVACGEYHTFILKNDGSIWACGRNSDGQLGLNSTTQKTSFTKVTTNINKDVKQVICGSNHTFILKNDGSLWSCGDNSKGQLGLNDTNERTTFTQVTKNINKDVKQVACGQNHTFILKNDGSVYSCGYNFYGQLGLNSTTNNSTFTKVTTNISNVKQIACGDDFVSILKNDGSLWSCGNNNYGQLGLGNNTQKNTFTKVTTNINNDVKQVACGGYYIFILKNDSSVYSCGGNGNGQLGVNSSTSKTSFTQVQRGF